MIKIISMWKRNPDLSEEQCEKHYLSHHTALALKALADAPGFIRYVQNKVIAQTNIDFNDAGKALPVTPEIDRMVELYFEDKKSFEKAMERPEMTACFNDHPNFMNINIQKSLVILEVSEAIPLEKTS